ncbi:hypothetical protein CSA_023972, partial [Cucumis sativus]
SEGATALDAEEVALGLRAEIAALDERRWLLNVVDDKVREADDWWMMERPLVADVGHRLRK